MNTLIVYATKYGCTEKCAKILSEKLIRKVDLCNLKGGKSVELSQYDQLIIGGSIYMGKIRKEVSEFCTKNLSVLKEKKIGLFICGMQEGDQAETQLNQSFPEELLVNAVARESFGGEFRFNKMNFMERFIIKMVTKKDQSSPAVDTKKDISAISEENMNRFVELMNNA